MSREIKFEFLYRGLPYSAENQERPWFKKVYSLSDLIEHSLAKLSDVHGQSELVAKRQFTGLADSKGVEVYEGDIIKQGPDIREVEFSTEDVASCGCCYDGFVGSGFVAWNLNIMKSEVIGNIYQNPELLK